MLEDVVRPESDGEFDAAGLGMDALRILLVEDSDDDAWLLVRALKRSGHAVSWRRVETEEALRTALAGDDWDAIVADYRLPRLSAPVALTILHDVGNDIPFIVVSGRVGEEVAAELMRSGAHDYVSKTNLARLAPAVVREVREAAVRRARRRDADAQRLFAEASAVLGAALDEAATLRGAVRMAVPLFADACELTLRGPNEEARRLREPSEREDGWAVIRGEEASALVEVAGEVLTGSVRPGHVVVPLVVRGTTLGTLLYVRDQPERRFEPDDLPVAAELARRIALAVDKARLFAGEQRAREEAQAAVRARDEFLTIASHELRTPVTAIRGSAQILLRSLERGTLEKERLARYLRTLDESSRQLSALTDDLLDVSLLEAGGFTLRRRDLDLVAFVQEVAERFRGHLGAETALQVTVDGPCSVYGDPMRLEQVLTNLLTNAVKYSPDGGEIAVRVRSDHDGGLVTVADQGIGLPSDRLEMIFEPFGRAPNAASRQIRGMGLGLYISRQIVNRHGGRIWARSAGEGEGSTFYVWLPGAEPIEQAGAVDPLVG